MLPKRNRLNKKSVEKVFTFGRSFHSSGLSLKYILDSQKSIPKISFIVPKSISKKATERNLLRRKGYEVIKEHLNFLPRGFIGIFIFNTKDKTKNSSENLKKEIKKLLNEENFHNSN